MFSWYKTAAKKSHAKQPRPRKWKFHFSQSVADLMFRNGFKIYFTNKHIEAPIDETVTKQINQRNWDE